MVSAAFRPLLPVASRRILAQTLSRPLSLRTLCLRPLSVPNAFASRRAFSVSAKTLREGTSDVTLAKKLEEEIQYEKEANAGLAGTEPEFLKAFRESGIWQLEDTAGNDEITFTRKFGNENLRLMFSIADIQNEPESEFEDTEGESQAAAEQEPFHSYPLRTSLSITKTSGTGCINVDMVCQEGQFIVDNIAYYADARLGTELTAESDWKRRGLYLGPHFDTLDVAVQDEFEKFLQERGINEQLALFIPEYAEYKEQKEYVKWLESVKSFVEL